MKTKVRITGSTFNGVNYKHVQIIEHPYKDSLSIEVIGYMEFRTFDYNPNYYKCVSYKCDSDKYQHFLKMGRLIKFIKKNSYWDSDIDTILALINAVTYTIQYNEWISVLDSGKNLYLINYVNEKGEKQGYKRIIAANELMAEKQMIKLNINSPSLELIGKLY